MTFEELYHSSIKRALDGKAAGEGKFDPYHLDCLLHPEKYPPVFYTERCNGKHCEGDCQKSCIFDAIERDADGKLTIDAAKCTGCSACIEACKMEKLAASRDILPAMKAVRESGKPAYALIAPAFLGQFTESVTPGKLRSAFQSLGFSGMLEVALFADILTMKEALEFDRHIHKRGDYQLTSCCCPIWIAMIRKIYSQLMPHVPGSVSPMIACGRVVKRLHPNAVTVFIGPCVAKKSEAREPDIAGAVDFVLTFQEIADVFAAAGIDPAALPENERDHSSRAGRVYAYAGGVSEAVESTVAKLAPHREITVKTRRADGVPACRKMIEELVAGNADENFFEGMGCPGGCVGGPKAIVNKDLGKKYVEGYGQDATYATPLENPYVMELLKKLGYRSVEELLTADELFTRKF